MQLQPECGIQGNDLTLAARQLAQDIPQVVHHLLTLLSRKCLCELLDRTAPKYLGLRHQPSELVLILRFFGIGHTPYMAPEGAFFQAKEWEYFQKSQPLSGLPGYSFVTTEHTAVRDHRGRFNAQRWIAERSTSVGRRQAEEMRRGLAGASRRPATDCN